LHVLQIAPPWFEVPPVRYGGTELVVAGLTEELVRRGHDVTLLASGGSRTTAQLVSEYETPPTSLLGDGLVELTHVTAIADTSAFDVVHDHTVYGAALAAARGTTPTVLTLHNPLTERSAPLLRRLARDVHLVGISHDQVGQRPDVPVPTVVHNGIDVDAYGPGDGRRGDDLLFLGRASPDKGPDLAIEVARRAGRRLVLAIKVNEPDERAYWDEVLAERCTSSDVEVVRDADHATKRALLRQAYAVLVPIRWPEPFGLVMAEAAACGAPVVAFARGAAPEIVVDGETGRLVDPTAGVEGLVAAVGELDAIEPARCIAHVTERFSVAAMADAYLAVYGEARGGHRPNPPSRRRLSERSWRRGSSRDLVG
jgi:glycosyltransferase involved in cell wall biosynthesis